MLANAMQAEQHLLSDGLHGHGRMPPRSDSLENRLGISPVCLVAGIRAHIRRRQQRDAVAAALRQPPQR